MSQSPSNQRLRAAVDRMHPAAAARAAVRRQQRTLAGWYVANRRRVSGGPAFWFDPFTAAVTLKYGGGIGAPIPAVRPAPYVWELAEVERIEHEDQAVTVAARFGRRHSRAVAARITRQERRSVTRPVRGPDTGSVRPESGRGWSMT
jgi:hypothetical protein